MQHSTWSNEHVLKTNRAVLWNKAKVYHKRAVASPSMLKKTLIIEFSGEGADTGALLFELSQEVVRQLRGIKDWVQQNFYKKPLCLHGHNFLSVQGIITRPALA